MTFFRKTCTWTLLLLLILVVSPSVFSQSESENLDTTIVKEIKPIPVIRIIPSIEETYAEAKLTEKKIEPKKNIKLIDSLFSIQVAFIKERSSQADEFIQANPNKQKVDNLINKWGGYRDQFKNWSAAINEYLSRNVILYEAIIKEEKKWNLTYDNAVAREAPDQLLSSVEEVIDDLSELKEKISEKNNYFLSLETGINNQIGVIDGVTEDLMALKNSRVYDLFNLRHPPIWKESFKKSNSETVKVGVESVKENSSDLWKQIKTGEHQIYIYFLIVLAIALGVLYLKRSFLKYGYNEKNRDLLHAKAVVVERPVWTINFLSLFCALVFFTNTPKLFLDIIVTMVLIATIPLVQPYMLPKFKNIPYIIVIVYILDSLKAYIWFSSPQYRIYLLLESIAVAATLIYFTYPYLKTRKLPLNRFGTFLVTLTPLIYALILISIISNILGYSNLADISLILCTQSSVLTLLFYAILMVVEGIGIGFINDHFNQKGSFDKTKKITLELKTLQVIRVLTFGFWLYYFLNMVDLYRPLADVVTSLLAEPFKVGSITFNIGIILTFIGILAASFLITSFVSFLLDGNEVKFNFIKLPKGIPAAISLVIRYFILAFGFVLALSALGIDLSKFNLMAGALGLGIGFGLQNIVSNFISGIILVFERPILPGDRVEVNNLMGTVNKIGVRSSHITTFDGAEVVVPNNNLIANDLINWTHTDNVKRIEILVGTSYDSDPNEVLKVLSQIANENPQVLKTPPPSAYFNDFGDSSLNFRLLFWVYFDNGLQCKSDVSVAIYNRFAELGIEIPFPQRVLHMSSTPNKATSEIPIIPKSPPSTSETDMPSDDENNAPKGRDRSSNW